MHTFSLKSELLSASREGICFVELVNVPARNVLSTGVVTELLERKKYSSLSLSLSSASMAAGGEVCYIGQYE
jgi:hypothetical protein